MADGAFCAAVNCMDGRVQESVIQLLKDHYRVDYVDMITEPGPNGILAAGIDQKTIDAIFYRIKISIDQHGSQVIAVVGHHDCAGNPGPKDQQISHTRQAVLLLRKMFPEVEVRGIWVSEDWRAEFI